MNRTLYDRIERLFGPEMMDMSSDPPIVYPRDVEALAETMRLISPERCKIMVTGGGTFPVPVSLGDRITVSLARMDMVLEVNPGDFLVVAQAGTSVDRTVEDALNAGLHLPLDITSGARATVGGAFMTAASGPYAAGYGSFRDYVIGAKCVTARGDVVTFGGRTMKNVTGYEMVRFLAGTMGLFAVAAELTIRTLPLPERRTMVVGGFRANARPLEEVSGIGISAGPVKRAELVAEQGLGGEVFLGIGIEGMDSLVESRVADIRERMERAGADSIREEAQDAFMEKRRLAATVMAEAGMMTLTVPPSAVAALGRVLREEFPSMPVIAHPIIGRIHVLPADGAATSKITERVLAVGGKQPSAWGRTLREGVGSRFTEPERTVARSLKRELDPDNILNSHLRWCEPKPASSAVSTK